MQQYRRQTIKLLLLQQQTKNRIAYINRYCRLLKHCDKSFSLSITIIIIIVVIVVLTKHATTIFGLWVYKVVVDGHLATRLAVEWAREWARQRRLNHKYRSKWARMCTTNTLKYTALQYFLECSQDQLAWNAHKSQVNTKQTDIDPMAFCFLFFSLLFRLAVVVVVVGACSHKNSVDVVQCFEHETVFSFNIDLKWVFVWGQAHSQNTNTIVLMKN